MDRRKKITLIIFLTSIVILGSCLAYSHHGGIVGVEVVSGIIAFVSLLYFCALFHPDSKLYYDTIKNNETNFNVQYESFQPQNNLTNTETYCSMCGGSGYYYNSCTLCGGRGSTRCSNCGGCGYKTGENGSTFYCSFCMGGSRDCYACSGGQVQVWCNH